MSLHTRRRQHATRLPTTNFWDRRPPRPPYGPVVVHAPRADGAASARIPR